MIPVVYTWFTLQPKSATEISWCLVDLQCNFEKYKIKRRKPALCFELGENMERVVVFVCLEMQL